MNKIIPLVIGILVGIQSLFGQDSKPPITWKDIANWEFIRPNTPQISSDGNWIYYVSGPTEGDLKATLKSTKDTLHYSYAIGAAPSMGVFNENAQFLAFYEAADFKTIKANQKNRRPSPKKLKVVALKDTSVTEFENVRDFSFSNSIPDWIAIRFDAQSGGPGGEKKQGSDLLLYHLTKKQSFNIGNVGEFAFNKSGQYLAYTVDAQGKNGNGIFLRQMSDGMTSVVENDKASFKKLNWNKEGTAFTLLKTKENKKYKDDVYTLIGVKNISAGKFTTHSYTGLDANQITAGYGISEKTSPYWSKDLSAIFFGISKIEKSDDSKKEEAAAKDSIQAAADSTTSAIAAADSTSQAKDSTTIANTKKPDAKPKGNKKDVEKPDMIIWNWQDKRLQSAQRNQLERDKNFTVFSVWNVNDNRFVSLADSSLKRITLSPDQRTGYAMDATPYEMESNLNGQSYSDVYLVDIKTGHKTLLLEKFYLNAISYNGISFSPDSKSLLYYREGNYYLIDLATKTTTDLTSGLATSFINQKVDNNVDQPATPVMDWSADSKFVFIRDNYDLWKIATNGKSAKKMTNNWNKSQQIAQSFYALYPDDDYIDLKKDQYMNVFNDATKEDGIAFLKAGSDQFEILVESADYYASLQRPKNSTSLFYRKENSISAPEVYRLQNNDFAQSQKLTENTPKQQKYAFSSGSKVISYVSDAGDTLQATLFLPADYVEGKSYPTITYIYERLTEGTNTYAMPAYPGGGFNRAVYTSNGYAVLMPDIKYTLNDPGFSAVACVVPAVKAAIATGIVDADRVGIHGHSWGGYQTSFLITQTDIFKAAVAGAPLTNMISMYSLIYWNSGSTNQSIFESSQGRLTTGYWDNWDAYVRNSPVYHIKKVKTPLVILHNDKDGAVDYTQGIEYFNGLRRLNKPVVMLTYNGENHGLVKDVNKKDYAVRMMEFFDHYLKGATSPDWWEKGIDLIDLEKHLEERAF